MSLKKIKEYLNKQRDTPCSWIGGCKIIEMSVTPNLIYMLNTILFKTPASYFVDSNKQSKVYIKNEKIHNNQLKSMPKKIKVRELILLDFKTDFKATIIKTTYY